MRDPFSLHFDKEEIKQVYLMWVLCKIISFLVVCVTTLVYVLQLLGLTLGPSFLSFFRKTILFCTQNICIYSEILYYGIKLATCFCSLQIHKTFPHIQFVEVSICSPLVLTLVLFSSDCIVWVQACPCRILRVRSRSVRKKLTHVFWMCQFLAKFMWVQKESWCMTPWVNCDFFYIFLSWNVIPRAYPE